MKPLWKWNWSLLEMNRSNMDKHSRTRQQLSSKPIELIGDRGNGQKGVNRPSSVSLNINVFTIDPRCMKAALYSGNVCVQNAHNARFNICTFPNFVHWLVFWKVEQLSGKSLGSRLQARGTCSDDSTYYKWWRSWCSCRMRVAVQALETSCSRLQNKRRLAASRGR